MQASVACKLWSLPALRFFTELTNRQPAIALGLVMAVGAVLAKRLGNRRRRCGHLTGGKLLAGLRTCRG